MKPDEAALLRDSGAAFGVSIDDEAVARIGRFLEVLVVWNRRVRLTGERDRATIIARHVADSLAPERWFPREGLVIDVGSGAGFPGIILCCIRPDLSLALLEARRRRASFLGEAIRTVPLARARVVCMRAGEDTADLDLVNRGQVVIARALRLDSFLAAAATLVGPDGVAIAMQTPAAVAAAPAVAAACGFRLLDTQEYRLLDARRRTLLRFAAL